MRIFVSTVSAGLLLAIGLLGLYHWQDSSGADRWAAAQDGGTEVTLEAGDLFFEPETLTLAAGDALNLTNTGVLPHNFVVEGYNDAAPIDIPRDGETDWTVPADLAPGEYTYYCAIPGHRQSGMHGTLTIVAADDAGGGVESTPDPSARAADPSGSPEDLQGRVDALEQQVDAQATRIADLETRLDALEEQAEP